MLVCSFLPSCGKATRRIGSAGFTFPTNSSATLSDAASNHLGNIAAYALPSDRKIYFMPEGP